LIVRVGTVLDGKKTQYLHWFQKQASIASLRRAGWIQKGEIERRGNASHVAFSLFCSSDSSNFVNE
jgi:hypothetical protein